MRGTLMWTLASMLLGSLMAQPASSAYIIVVGDPQGFTCPNVPVATPTNIYVVAAPYPEACGGITGAEFRIQGLPTNAEGWFYGVVQALPGAQVEGDPLTGIRLHSACATSEAGVQVLCWFMAIGFTPVSYRQLSVVAHQTPSDPQFDCPVLASCDMPTPASLCTLGAYTWLNGSPGFCPCQFDCYAVCPPLAVEAGTWSLVKSLFR